MEEFKSGYIALVGRPNAGKSTLLNALIEQKISIVSHHPQTTRDKVLGIWTDEQAQMIFLDTPGVFSPKDALGQYMTKSIESGVRDVDCIVVVMDGHKNIMESDLEILEKYLKTDTPVVAVVTKTDISQPETLMPQLAKLNNFDKLKSIFAVSARKNKNIKQLRDHLKQYLTENIMYYDKDDVTDRPQRFIVCELIREKILQLTEDEIPFGIGVALNKMTFDGKKQLWDIDANIYVEKASHKPIIIGKQGQLMKQIGENARMSIEAMLGNKVFLALWVKVKEDWRNSDFMLREIGYDKKEI